MAGLLRDGTRLLDPDRHPSVTVLRMPDLAPDSVDRLLVAVPGAGLSPTDTARCSRLVGRTVGPASDASGDSAVSHIAHDPDPAAQGAAAARLLPPAGTAHIYLPGDAGRVRGFVVGLLRGAYRLKPPAEPRRVALILTTQAAVAAAREAATVAAWVLRARDWANEPSNTKDPAWLADRATECADERMQVQVWDTVRLRELGFGGLIAVGAGSARPPLCVQLEYRDPDAPAAPHVVLVGKGITFDSGGLSLKPAVGMPLMKTDMTGAAAVLGAMGAVAQLRLPARVTALLACAENMPSGSAMRPGDVVRHAGGRTTEVLNTDAEGRLVLADCLAYAAERLHPDYLVDVASLTGAATVGLGRQHAALYCDDPRLLRGLQRAAAASGDAVWRMPLVPEYRSAIASTVADAANTNTEPHTSAGSITAALFLQPFAAGSRWAHLDIAGAARAEADRADSRPGATGFGVALLSWWVAALSGRRW